MYYVIDYDYTYAVVGMISSSNSDMVSPFCTGEPLDGEAKKGKWSVEIDEEEEEDPEDDIYFETVPRFFCITRNTCY